METGRSKNVATLYDESLNRLAKADKNLFRASAGACATKSLRATTIMMDGNKDEALMARNKEYTNWMMKIVTRTGAAFSFEELQDLHAMCIGKSISSFNIMLGYETFCQLARRFGYLDPMIVRRMFEVFDEDNSKQISFEELAYNIAR